jgi:hypothetical protein
MCRKQANVAPSAARSGRKESGKAKEPSSQAAEDVTAADSLGSPPVPTSNYEQERQLKEEKCRRKEGRRRRREEKRMQELEGALKGTPATEKRDAPPGTGRQTEMDGPAQERERKEEKRRRKEEKRRREAAAASGVDVQASIPPEKEKDRNVRGVPGQGPSVSTDGAAREEEDRRRAKEEKRKAKEERRKAREAQASPTVLPHVASEIAGAASSKRAGDEMGVKEQDQKRTKGETSGLVSKRPRDGEVELERGTGKKPRQGEGQPNGVPKIVLDEDARRREEKLRRKEERRRVREERAAAGQPSGTPADAGPKIGGGKRPREEGGALDMSQASDKKQRSGGREGKSKRERAEVGGPEEGGPKKQRIDGGAATVPVEVNGVVRREGGEERRKRKEERKRGREAAAVSSPVNGGAIASRGGMVENSKGLLFEDEANERKRARKEEKRKQQLGSEGQASVEQGLGLSTPDKARHRGKRKAGENGRSDDATITESKEKVALVSSKGIKKKRKTDLNGP